MVIFKSCLSVRGVSSYPFISCWTLRSVVGEAAGVDWLSGSGRSSGSRTAGSSVGLGELPMLLGCLWGAGLLGSPWPETGRRFLSAACRSLELNPGKGEADLLLWVMLLSVTETGGGGGILALSSKLLSKVTELVVGTAGVVVFVTLVLSGRLPLKIGALLLTVLLFTGGVLIVIITFTYTAWVVTDT